MNAFVNVAVPAEVRVQALISAANTLERAGFSIVNVESASEFKRLPFHDRRKPLMKVLVARARRTQQAQLGKFYSWPEGSHED